jgi:hypothetical protein
MIREGLTSLLGSVDVVVLAQASMANALDEMSEISAPVLASPELGVLHVSSELNARYRLHENAQI